MDYQLLRTNRINFNFEAEPSKQNLTVNVIIADNSHAGMFPIAFQYRHDDEFKDEAFDHFDPSTIRLENDSFINLGYVDVIHKKNRMVFLRNGNTINYNHLIFISDKKQSVLGSLSQQEDLIAAYCTLISAVKTRKKLYAQNLTAQQQDKTASYDVGFKSTSNLSQVESTLPLNVRQALLKLLKNKSLNIISQTPTTSGKLLVELQIYTAGS